MASLPAQDSSVIGTAAMGLETRQTEGLDAYHTGTLEVWIVVTSVDEKMRAPLCFAAMKRLATRDARLSERPRDMSRGGSSGAEDIEICFLGCMGGVVQHP